MFSSAEPAVAQGRWREWGFLRWKDRSFVLDKQGNINVWKSDKGPAGPPNYTWRAAECTVTVDDDSNTRFTLDNGAALLQLKAENREARAEFVQAQQSFSATSADILEQRKKMAKYPDRVGKYALGQLLGQGGFAKVRSGINWDTGERIAAKIMPAKVAQDPQHMKEIIAMGSLNHPNVVRLCDIVYQGPSSQAPGRIFLVLELASGGELFSKVVDAGFLTEDKARFYFRQIMQGTAYCHAKSLCHRDLKLENLLLDSTGKVLKITDFGFAKNLSADGGGEAKTILGTAVYVAPEVLDGEVYDGYKSDIWACGVVLYTMCAGAYPFDFGYHGGVGPANPKNNALLMKRLQAAKYEVPAQFSASLQALLKRTIEPVVSSRYTAEECLKDPWCLAEDQSVEQVNGLMRQMSHGPIASIAPDVPPEYWMERLATCRQAHVDAAVDDEEGGMEPEPEAVQLRERLVSFGEPGALAFDDEGGDEGAILVNFDDSPR